jgi:MarR family transcriptional regulator, organic hydroperoxide resistance regulator
MSVDAMTVLLLRQWYEVSRSVDHLLADALGGLGLTESAGAALWALDPALPAPTMRDLARTLSCDPSNASLVTAKLEQDGLLERRPHPSDGRARVLFLTERGQQVLARLIADVAALTPLRRLSPAQQRQLSKLLDALGSSPE